MNTLLKFVILAIFLSTSFEEVFAVQEEKKSWASTCAHYLSSVVSAVRSAGARLITISERPLPVKPGASPATAVPLFSTAEAQRKSRMFCSFDPMTQTHQCESSGYVFKIHRGVNLEVTWKAVPGATGHVSDLPFAPQAQPHPATPRSQHSYVNPDGHYQADIDYTSGIAIYLYIRGSREEFFAPVAAPASPVTEPAAPVAVPIGSKELPTLQQMTCDREDISTQTIYCQSAKHAFELSKEKLVVIWKAEPGATGHAAELLSRPDLNSNRQSYLGNHVYLDASGSYQADVGYTDGIQIFLYAFGEVQAFTIEFEIGQ